MKKILFFLLLLICCQQLAAQERTVTGRILDGGLQNEPLIGATIAIGDGKLQNGTVTDYNGDFTLKVPQGTQTLTVRYLGYETGKLTLVNGTDHYQLTLKPEAHNIGEVVVTGYQKIDRRKLTAAVSTLSISDEAVGAVKNIDQRGPRVPRSRFASAEQPPSTARRSRCGCSTASRSRAQTSPISTT